MVNNNKETLSIIRNAAISLFPDCKVLLFGSRARNDNSTESDYDFLVITRNTGKAKYGFGYLHRTGL